MTRLYNITKSSITKQYKMHTWLKDSQGNVIDEGCNVYKTKGACYAALGCFTDRAPLKKTWLDRQS